MSDYWKEPAADPKSKRGLPSQFSMPSTSTLKTMQELMPELMVLANPAGRKHYDVSLALFGQNIYYSNARATSEDRDEQGNKSGSYHLSLTFLSGSAKYCILNNEFLAQGARLDNGAVITRIENQRVWIVNKTKQHWVCLNEDISNQDILNQDVFGQDQDAVAMAEGRP
ncbi:MAG: hypothetical protein GY874_10105 [Desulfobacteraceae bacterium]|nr:hypothetical protein [Desulfobacteraceae bacterium]